MRRRACTYAEEIYTCSDMHSTRTNERKCVQNSSTHTQKIPHICQRDVHMEWRAQHTHNRAQIFSKEPTHTQKSPHECRRDLHMQRCALHTHKRGYVCSKEPYTHVKEPLTTCHRALYMRRYALCTHTKKALDIRKRAHACAKELTHVQKSPTRCAVHTPKSLQIFKRALDLRKRVETCAK